MVVDLAFELSYMLSDELGLDVEVKGYRFDPSTGMFCVVFSAGGVEGEACTVVRACRGLEGVKAERCLSRTLAAGGKPFDELAAAVRRVIGEQ